MEGRPPGSVGTGDGTQRERRIAGVLFFLTCCSVYAVNLGRFADGPLLRSPDAFRASLVFTLTLMAFLLAHEMGHYAVARLHAFSLSLPWFLPAPFLVGTLGAIIRLREMPRTRVGLLEMGAAGPLAGLLVLAIAISARLMLAESAPPPDPLLDFSRPPLWWLLSGLLTGGPPPEVSTRDPVLFAAWIGCLLTAMNLLPFGQLDGGHVLAALFPARAGTIGWAVTFALLAAGLLWPGWAVWAGLLHLLGARRPVVVERDRRGLGGRSVGVAVVAVVAFLLCATPVPVGFR